MGIGNTNRKSVCISMLRQYSYDNKLNGFRPYVLDVDNSLYATMYGMIEDDFGVDVLFRKTIPARLVESHLC